MKQLKFLETKRTPRYSLRKFSVGMVSVLLGVTIFGINFTNHSVKAATTESVEKSNSPANSNSQQTLAAVLPTTEQTNAQKATGATGEVQQSSASKNATATESVEKSNSPANSNSQHVLPTTEQTNAQKATGATEEGQQGSADTDIKSLDIRSLTAISAAKLATMNLMQANGINGTDTDGNAAGTPGTNRNAGDTVDPNNINDQPAKENQKLANDNNLTSSDNYSSNIYQGTDGKYYKVVTIYGNDYVYHAADIQANGTATGQKATTAEDTKNNINISKEDLGNGQTRWTVVFFPHQGLQNVGGSVNGLVSAKFGIALTNDYQIVGNVDMEVINDPNQKYTYYKFEDGSNSATDITIKNPPAEVDFSFNPKTDVDPNTGLINNSKTLPAYNNKYLQPSYYFTTNTSYGKTNLWQTYFFNNGNDVYYNNAYDGTTPYLGGVHDFHFNNFIIKNKTGVDGLESKDLNDPKAQIPIIYDTRNEFNSNGVFNSVNFNQAMEFKSHGYASKLAWKDLSQHSSYVISFTTQHTDSHEIDLISGLKNQQFSGISANIYSYQNGFYNMFSRLYGEQRALNAAGAVVKPNDVISGWVDATKAMDQIKKDYLNNAQIYALRHKIQNNVTDSNALNNIIKEGNSLNDAMKKLGNSIGQYDDGSFADHKEDTTKASDRYKYADPDKKAAYDNATEVTKALINKDTGTYADQATVEKLTEAENKVWNELNGVVNAAKNAIDQAAKTKDAAIDNSSLTAEEKDTLKQTVAAAANEAKGNIDAATKDADVKTAQSDGEKAINAVEIPTSSKTKNDANSDLDNTADAAKKAIDETSGLTDDQKQTAKDQIDKAVDDAKENIKNASDNKGVADATDAGKLAIDKVSAKAAIDAAVAAKKSEIAQAPLTAEEAKPLNNLVDQDAAAAKAAIDAATTSAAVETAKNNGVETINNIKVPTTSATKDDANKATDAGNITPNVPGDKVTVKDPSHLTDDEKNQVKNNVDNANKDKFPDGTTVTVGDDGTTTVTYPDGSKDVIAGTDLVIAAKGEDVLGSKYHSHKNGSNSSQADRVKGASTANGSIANAGNNLGVKAESDNAFVGVKAESDNAFVGVKGESDNAIGNNKATSLKTLPQTGTKDTSILGVLGMLLASLGLFGFKKKRDKE